MVLLTRTNNNYLSIYGIVQTCGIVFSIDYKPTCIITYNFGRSFYVDSFDFTKLTTILSTCNLLHINCIHIKSFY